MSKYHELIEKYKEITRKDCCEIEIVSGEFPELLDDKLGGDPYLPMGVEWPRDSKGLKMNLLLQLNLKNIKLDGFPGSGILEIFTPAEIDWPCECKVFIFEEGLETQKELIDQDMDKFFIPYPMKIRFNKTYEHMPMSNEESDEILCKLLKEFLDVDYEHRWDVPDDEYYNEIYEGITKSNIGGYPDFVQDDSGEYNSKKDICILKLDSNLHEDIYIGDCGILRVIIPKEDLKNENFDNVYLDWDCC